MTTTLQIPELLGHTLTLAISNDYELHLTREDGKVVRFHHYQDCCESVYIESIVGDLADLVGSPILVAEYTTSGENTKHVDDCEMWTFYKFATAEGWVDVRWHGSSNGYYSVSVNMGII